MICGKEAGDKNRLNSGCFGGFFPPEFDQLFRQLGRFLAQLLSNQAAINRPIHHPSELKGLLNPHNDLTLKGVEVSKERLSREIDVIVDNNEVLVAVGLNPHIKSVHIKVSERRMHILSGSSEVGVIELPVKVIDKEGEVRVRNGLLVTKLARKPLTKASKDV